GDDQAIAHAGVTKRIVLGSRGEADEIVDELVAGLGMLAVVGKHDPAVLDGVEPESSRHGRLVVLECSPAGVVLSRRGRVGGPGDHAANVHVTGLDRLGSTDLDVAGSLGRLAVVIDGRLNGRLVPATDGDGQERWEKEGA